MSKKIEQDMLLRVPPQAVDMEQASLAAMILDKDAVSLAIEIIEPEYYYKNSHREIFTVIVELFNKNIEIDPLSISEILKERGSLDESGGFYYLAEIVNSTPSSVNIEHYLDVIKERALSRFLIKECDMLINRAYEQSEETTTLLSYAENKFSELSDIGTKKGLSDKIIIPKDVMKSDFDEYYETGGEKSVSTGWANIDEYWTVGKSQQTVITGIPGSGKSNWMDALMVNLTHQSKWKWVVFSPENMPVSRQVRSLVEKYLEEPMFKYDNTRGFTKEKYTKVLNEFVYPNFKFINPFTVDRKLETVLSAIRKNLEGADGIVIDPWNEIEHTRPNGMTETEYIGMSLMKMRDEAIKNKCHLFIIAHPTKLKKEDGKYPIATPYDISGSANWWNKPDNCLSIYRDFATDQVSVCIQKIRIKDFGKIGKVGLNYIKGSGHYETPLPY